MRKDEGKVLPICTAKHGVFKENIHFTTDKIKTLRLKQPKNRNGEAKIASRASIDACIKIFCVIIDTSLAKFTVRIIAG
jgi:hypothetical protein